MKVGVDLSGLDALRKDLRRLSTCDLKRAVYGTLHANERLARRFRSDIEGSPARFTRIHPGEKRSAVVNNRARREVGSVTSSIAVQKRQSRYLRFAVGEDDVRTPGEAGFSTKTNLMPTLAIRNYRI
ncbi:hypothetical protein [Aureimonas sp. AU40]|uniref:hypothetical protein n=1 Tax=Aureimonas sp. AU40 TaxID=1637747 RepID=UPI0007853F41|nr:hypothetical protein [Aureimonas sp. AU40]